MKKIIRCAGFVLVFALIISYTYKVLSWKDTTGFYLSSVEQLYSTDKDLMDVVFFGSSHLYCGVNPAVLWEEHGTASFDMAISGEDRNSTYHYLKEVLKTQSPKLVFVDMYGLLFEKQAVEGNVYRNLLSMKYSKNAIDIVNGYVEEEDRLDYYLRWPIIHTRYRELGRYDFYQLPRSIFGRGAIYPFGTVESYEDNNASGITEIGQLNFSSEKWLDDLVTLSEEENFDLVFMLIPFNITEEEQLIINAAKEFSKDKGIEFIDFNQLDDVIGLDRLADMNDTHHANAWGAEKITKYLYDEVISEYDFPDHRGDDRYHLWDEDLRFYKDSVAVSNIRNTINVYDYIAMSMELEDAVIFLSLDGEYENIVPELERLGITEEDTAGGGKWVYEKGAWTKLMSNVPGEFRSYEIDKFNTVTIQYIPFNAKAGLMLQRESLINTENGLNIAVYDRIMREPVGTRCVDNQ